TCVSRMETKSRSRNEITGRLPISADNRSLLRASRSGTPPSTSHRPHWSPLSLPKWVLSVSPTNPPCVRLCGWRLLDELSDSKPGTCPFRTVEDRLGAGAYACVECPPGRI